MERFSNFKNIVRQQVPMAMHTWFQLGGPAEFFAEPRIEEELAALLNLCKNESIPTRTLGFGSNIIVSDMGVPGMVFRLTAGCFTDIRIEGNTIIAGSGAKLGRVITAAVHAGLSGIENLIGIPGTVGGAIMANMGTNSGTIGQWVKKIRLANDSGKIIEIAGKDFAFGLGGHSLQDVVLLEATVELEEEDAVELSKRMQKLWIVRKTTFPAGQCAGYIFKNPRGLPPGELIERSGLKGTRIGGAVISERHANFIIAEPECTSSDILRLIDLVRDQVLDRTEVELELSVQIW